MATLRPFRALRPSRERAKEMLSLPYDVMDREEAVKMAEGKPFSFLHVSRAEIDLPELENPYDRRVYERARKNMDGFLLSGALKQDEKPMLYIYRETMDGRRQTGIAALASLDEYLDNTIKKHEFTLEAKEQDRINHFDVCNANTEPVFLTYRDDKRIRTLIEAWIATHEAEYDILSEDSIEHELWPVDDDGVIAALCGLFGEIPALYIADGHHRSASAAKVGLKRRKEQPDYDGSEEFNFFMAVFFPAGDLKIFDYNRVLKDLNGLSEEAFLEALGEAGFSCEERGKAAYRPEKKHEFSMYLDGKWYSVNAADRLLTGDIIKDLDVSLLQDNILGPILGIEDPRTDKRIDFVGGIRGLNELERRCAEDMRLAFALYPVEIADIMAVSDAGLTMPPKSTWFEPKLGSGLFIHMLG